MSNRLISLLLLVLALAGCAKPADVTPALWQVDGPKGERAWLFGTIHALPKAVSWRSPTVDTALKSAGVLVLEVADIEDDSRTAQAFASLATSPGLPPLEHRVAAELRDELTAELRETGIKPKSLDRYETWAAALMIQNAAAAAGDNDSGNGIDRALARSWSGPVAELEGAAAQLAIFDALPEPQQRALLGAVLSEAEGREARLGKLQTAWARGDMDLIGRETDDGFIGQPDLRVALLVSRNRVWADRIEEMLRAGKRPFVAVGAAHLAGEDGLPTALAARGWKVTRLQ